MNIVSILTFTCDLFYWLVADSLRFIVIFSYFRKIRTCLDDMDFVGYLCLYFIYRVNKRDVNEEDEKLFDSFFVKNTLPQYTLADIIIKKIKDNDAELAEGLIIMHTYLCFVFSLLYIVWIPLFDCKSRIFFWRRASWSRNGSYDS